MSGTALPTSLDRVDGRSMTALSAGHMTIDACQGAVPALLPFLIAQRGFSYATASLLVFAATLSSSIVQPVFGHYSDRHSIPWLMPLGLVTAGTGIGLVGLAPSYPLTFLAILVSGLGVAAFHPEGSRFANYVSGPRRATGMSLFSLGGNIGFAMGPALVTPAVLLLGLNGSLILIVPNVVMALVLARELPRLRAFVPSASPRLTRAEEDRDDWGSFVRLTLAISARSCAYTGLLTFLPLYLIHFEHASKGRGDAALTILLAGGAIGTLIGGRLADRVGRRAVLVGTMAVLPPLIILLTLVSGWLALLVAGLVGAATIATFSVTVVMGQEYLPSRIGIASGVTLGFSIGVGGLMAPLLGVLSDASGLHTTFYVIAAFPLVGLALALMLPKAPRGVRPPTLRRAGVA